MFDQILIPLDGSQTAQRALPVAMSLAKAFHSEIDLVHVLGQSLSDTTTQVDPLLWHMRKAEVETYLTSIAQMFTSHNLPAKRTILEGATAERLVAHAAAEEAELVIMSSHGQSGISGWNVSSVAQKVIARVNRSVMLVRAFQQQPVTEEPATPFHFQRLLVPLDGSRRAECILPVADKLALAYDATVWLIHTVNLSALTHPFHSPSEEAPPPSDVATQYEQAATDYLHQTQAQMKSTTKTTILHGGSIITTLNRFAEQESIDLMLFSAHGHSNSKQPYGSIVTNAIIHGGTSLLIFQDLPPAEIEPTRAQIAASQQPTIASERTNHHAQPAFWTP